MLIKLDRVYKKLLTVTVLQLGTVICEVFNCNLLHCAIKMQSIIV
jgi:hypothetical protein